MKKEIKIIRINPFEQPATVKAIALVYQQSFGGKPWNEGYLCPLCESVFARPSTFKTCPTCAEKSESILIVEYWPMSKIISDFYHEMKRKDSICVIARLDKKIIGFAWGHQISADQNLDNHLDAPELHRSLRGDFFYLDECALAPSHQGRGVGRLLVNQIFHEQQQGRVLLRTMNNSQMCNLIKNMGGKIIQHISRDRIIMQLLTS